MQQEDDAIDMALTQPSGVRWQTSHVAGCRRVAWTSLLQLSIFARLTSAQTPGAEAVAALVGKVEPGDRIFVTDGSGVQTGGRLLRLSPAEVSLLADGKEQLFSSNRIVRVEKTRFAVERHPDRRSAFGCRGNGRRWRKLLGG